MNERERKLRETVLNKCKTPEEREEKRKDLEYKDMLKSRSLDKSLGGTERKCDRCGKLYIVQIKLRQPFCRACLLAERQIYNHGSLDKMKKEAEIKRKETCLKKYGDENYNNRSQAKETCTDKYGVDNPAKVKEIYDRGLESCRIKLNRDKKNNG